MGGMGGMGVGGDMPLTQEMLNELNKVSDIFNPLMYNIYFLSILNSCDSPFQASGLPGYEHYLAGAAAAAHAMHHQVRNTPWKLILNFRVSE